MREIMPSFKTELDLCSYNFCSLAPWPSFLLNMIFNAEWWLLFNTEWWLLTIYFSFVGWLLHSFDLFFAFFAPCLYLCIIYFLYFLDCSPTRFCYFITVEKKKKDSFLWHSFLSLPCTILLSLPCARSLEFWNNM